MYLFKITASVKFFTIAFAFLTDVAAAQPSGTLPEVFEGVGVEEQLGSYLPSNITFLDESGQEVSLGSIFHKDRPVVLNLVYHDCPMLCNLLLDALTQTLRQVDWLPGREFDIITVSFSPLEGPDLASKQKQHYLEMLAKPEASKGWSFLTGSQSSIQHLAQSVGFEFRWVEVQKQYAHPATLIFVSGERKITRYLYGLEYAPRDFRNALVEASEGKVGNALDQIVLYCFQYDPEANSYVPHAMNIMKLGGLLTLLSLGFVLAVLWKREGMLIKETKNAST